MKRGNEKEQGIRGIWSKEWEAGMWLFLPSFL